MSGFDVAFDIGVFTMMFVKLGWQGISEPGESHAMTATLRKMTMSKKYAGFTFPKLFMGFFLSFYVTMLCFLIAASVAVICGSYLQRTYAPRSYSGSDHGREGKTKVPFQFLNTFVGCKFTLMTVYA